MALEAVGSSPIFHPKKAERRHKVHPLCFFTNGTRKGRQRSRDKTAGYAVLSARGRVGAKRRGESHISPQQKKSSRKTTFFERCVPLTRNVMRTSCVMRPADVMCASRVKEERISLLCGEAANHHFCRRQNHHLHRRCKHHFFSVFLIYGTRKGRQAVPVPQYRVELKSKLTE